MRQLTCSIVLYNTDEKMLAQAISSILQSSLLVKIFLVDNSETDALKLFAKPDLVEYIFNNKNIGYGAAHNIAIKKAKGVAEYHLVLNPDISFTNGVLENLFAFMQQNLQVGQVMPKVLYTNGDLQKLCKLLPTPFDLFARRFLKNSDWAKKSKERYDLSFFDYNSIVNLPNLSGCFMFFRSSILHETGGFDERFFMYLEDIDLTRRVHKISQTIFYPLTNIYHGYEKESYFNSVLLRHHIISAIKYFNKWGWFFDKERTGLNKEVLHKLNYNKHASK